MSGASVYTLLIFGADADLDGLLVERSTWIGWP
jgi:hypothetical protein